MKVPALTALFLIASVLLWSQETVLDLGQCLELALKNNSTLAQGRISLENAERENSAKHTQLIPSLSLEGGVSAGGAVFGGTGTNSGISISGGITGTLSLNTGYFAGLRQKELIYQIESLSYASSEREIRSKAEQYFYLLLTLKENLTLLEENKNLAEKQLERVTRLYGRGLAGELELLQSRLGLEKAKQNSAQSGSYYRTSKRSFAVLLGLSPEADFELSGELRVSILEGIDKKELITRLGLYSDIEKAELSVLLSQQNLAAARASLYGPALRLNTQWNAASNNGFSEAGPVSLSLSIPLDSWIPGSSASLSRDLSASAIESAKVRAEQTTRETLLSLLNTLSDLEQENNNITLAELQVGISERSYQLSEEAYSKGTLEQLDLENARNNLLEAKQNLLTAQYNYLINLIQLRDLVSAKSLQELYEVR